MGWPGRRAETQQPGDRQEMMMNIAMKLTDEQTRLVAQFCVDHNGGKVEDYLDGIDVTRDPFDRYDGGSHDGHEWNQWAGQSYESVGGYPGVHYESVQVAKGSTRRQLWVVDFGHCRAIYQL